MISAPFPSDEPARLENLLEYHLLDTPPEESFDDLVKVAATVCDVPIALVSLIDETRQWFKAKVGIEATETRREVAFCAHAILQRAVMIVPDATADVRFVDNPLVTSDPHIRFYAGTPLETAAGHRLGTLCVIDRRPRTLTQVQLDLLARLGRQVVRQIELRSAIRRLAESITAERQAERGREVLAYAVDHSMEGVALLDGQGRYTYMNHAHAAMYGFATDQLLGQSWRLLYDPDVVARIERDIFPRLLQTGEWSGELLGRKQNGDLFDVEIALRLLSGPAAGGQEVLSCTCRDITLRRRAEEAVQKSHDGLERRVKERTDELRAAHERLSALSRRLVQTQESERRRIARDLHDEIGQALTALKINLQILQAQGPDPIDQALADSLDLADRLLHQVRQLAVDLRPHLLDELGLNQAVRLYAERQAERNGWQLSFSSAGDSGNATDEALVTAYRIIQEGITNIARHAFARQVSVELRWDDSSIELTVMDDGVGFDAGILLSRSPRQFSSGLVGMEERARLAGGRLLVQSSPHAGSRIKAWLPLNRDSVISEGGKDGTS